MSKHNYAKNQSPVSAKTVEDIETLTAEETIILHAHETAKACLDIYFTEGLTLPDYSYAYKVLGETLVYIQDKRKRPAE
jgi:hypothetical protein